MSAAVASAHERGHPDDRLIDIGVFQPRDRVELLGGELIVSEPQSEPHYTAIGLTEAALRAALGAGWVVRAQGPIALDAECEPEPDIAVVPGTWRDFGRDPPSRPVLVVEEPVGPDGVVAPLAAPEARVRVSDLLP